MSEAAQNDPSVPLTGKMLRAAQLLAEGELTQAEIAERAGVGESTLKRWRKRPDFQATVKDLADEYDAELIRRGISRRAHRIEALNRRWAKLLQVIEERAADPRLARAPGGKTGLIVRQLKALGSGPNLRIVQEFVLDAALLRELRELEKQAAIEMGQWAEKRELTGADGLPIKVYLGMDWEKEV